MSPYLFTMTFLLMMSFITSSEANRYVQSFIENNCYLASTDLFVDAEELRELSHVEELREVENEEDSNPKPRPPKRKKSNSTKDRPRIPSLKINLARPPDNSRLNIYALTHKEPNKSLPKEFSLYEVFARVMRELYQKSDFFNEIANVEYLILDKLIEKKEESANFNFPDEFSTLDFEDSKLQEIFYQMLKGSKETPSLLNYITFNKIDSPGKQTRKINLMFADELILKAIFPEGRAAEKLIEGREKIWQEIFQQEKKRLAKTLEKGKGRSEFGEDTKTLLEEVLISEGYENEKYKGYVFDLTLSEPGSIIFVEDPLTNKLVREKYTPPPKRTAKK